MDPVTKRVEMINGHFDLPEDTVLAMMKVREAVETCARSIQASTKICDAVILPHATLKNQ